MFLFLFSEGKGKGIVCLFVGKGYVQRTALLACWLVFLSEEGGGLVMGRVHDGDEKGGEVRRGEGKVGQCSNEDSQGMSNTSSINPGDKKEMKF